MLIVVAVGACSSSGHSSASEPSTTTTTDTSAQGWDAGALTNAQQLADTARAKGIACDGYNIYAHDAIAKDYAKANGSVPCAMTQFTSSGNENITFEVFTSQSKASVFLGQKLVAVCTTVRIKKEPDPNFPYVAGPAWFVEPDNAATAARLATALGGSAKTGSCGSF